MAEYSNVAVQTVAANGSVIFSETPICCNKGYVLHRQGSGVFTLKGGCGNQCRARYRVTFNGNIAIPTGGTVEAISLALSLDGEALGSAAAIVTPAAVENYFNVSVDTFIDVPRCCCMAVAVRNTSTQAINVQNANLIIERVA